MYQNYSFFTLLFLAQYGGMGDAVAGPVGSQSWSLLLAQLVHVTE
jgi:hypothetical protein